MNNIDEWNYNLIPLIILVLILIILLASVINGYLNLIFINIFKYNEYNLTNGCPLNKSDNDICDSNDKLICYNNNFFNCIIRGGIIFIFEFIFIVLIIFIIKNTIEKYKKKIYTTRETKQEKEEEDNKL